MTLRKGTSTIGLKSIWRKPNPRSSLCQYIRNLLNLFVRRHKGLRLRRSLTAVADLDLEPIPQRKRKRPTLLRLTQEEGTRIREGGTDTEITKFQGGPTNHQRTMKGRPGIVRVQGANNQIATKNNLETKALGNNILRVKPTIAIMVELRGTSEAIPRPKKSRKKNPLSQNIKPSQSKLHKGKSPPSRINKPLQNNHHTRKSPPCRCREAFRNSFHRRKSP